jgi:hypothetical protein
MHESVTIVEMCPLDFLVFSCSLFSRSHFMRDGVGGLACTYGSLHVSENCLDLIIQIILSRVFDLGLLFFF